MPVDVDCMDVWNSTPSATGIAKLARKALSGEHEETVLHGEPSAKDVFDAVKAEMHLQLALRMNSDDRAALASLAVVVDPAVFVIGGGVSKVRSGIDSVCGKGIPEESILCE